jgi:polyhydroxyalkanoate synthase
VPVRPEELALPALVAIPSRDRIVPAASAEPLAAGLPEATVIRPAAGHVSMVVGDRAPEQLWQPLAAWLRRIAPRRSSRPVRPACATA